MDFKKATLKYDIHPEYFGSRRKSWGRYKTVEFWPYLLRLFIISSFQESFSYCFNKLYFKIFDTKKPIKYFLSHLFDSENCVETVKTLADFATLNLLTNNFGYIKESPAWVIEQRLNLVIYGFKDLTGRNAPNTNSNSSFDSSLKELKRESSSSILRGFEIIWICSSISGQVDSSIMSSIFSPHSFHSNPKHLFGTYLKSLFSESNF